MKNLILGTFFLTLLTFTYFFQELGTKQANLNKELQESLIKTGEMGELVSVAGPYFYLKKNDYGTFSFVDENFKNKEVDQIKLDQLFSILSNLRVTRHITEMGGVGIEEFVPADSKSIRFDFVDNYLSFTLGNKIETDQSFYVLFETKDEKKLMVVNDISAHSGTYMKETFYRNDEKYRKQASLFILTNEFFQKMKLLNEDHSKWESVSILNVLKKDFKIMQAPLRTEPAKYDGIEYNIDRFEEFFKMIEGLIAQETFTRTKNSKLDDFVSQLTIDKNDSSKLYISLYRKLNDKKGYYVVLDDGKVIFKISNEKAKPFFYNIQDFWHRQPIELNKIHNFSLAQNDENFNLQRKTKKSGGEIEYKVIKSGKAKANHRNLEKLLEFFDQESDRISLFDKFDKELYPNSFFQISIGDKKFKVIKTEVELLLVDLKSQLKYHFYTGQNIPFSNQITDYIFKEKK